MSLFFRLFLLLFATVRITVGGTFLFTGDVTNHFVVPENTVALISGISAPFTSTSPPGEKVEAYDWYPAVIIGGETNIIHGGVARQSALAGPLELVFNNTLAISCRFITNTSFKTILAKWGVVTAINVPAGKTIHFLSRPLRNYGQPEVIKNATIATDSVSVTNVAVFADTELDGPLKIAFDPRLGGEFDIVITYFFVDRATVLPDERVLQAGTGGLQLQVEKSDDLRSWGAAVLLPIVASEKAFYRLKIE